VPLTVKDILEKTFKRSFKGYDEDEVDKFLDQIIDEFKALQNELSSVKDELAAARENVGKAKHSEETIMNTLVSAQKTSEHMISDAKRKAEILISSAEATAKQKAEQTLRELDESKARIEELKSCAQGFAASFANMINTQAAYFEKTYRSYFGQDFAPLGGINTDALEKIDKDITRSLEEMGVYEKSTVSQEQDAAPNTTGTETNDLSDGDEKSGYMELFEINKKLSDIENVDYSPDSEDKSEPGTYGDYSWIYDSDGKSSDQDVAIMEQKDKDELKSLIEEIIE
jgi:cell division initiation protein